jgi:hypothetical protein
VWKINEEYYLKDEVHGVTLKSVPGVHEFANLPIMSFLKIISRITISKRLIKYRKNPGLNQRLPNYSVKMGFGLHYGWGIEGAIGSNFKIDASYLSPNVNMASRLEAATK